MQVHEYLHLNPATFLKLGYLISLPAGLDV